MQTMDISVSRAGGLLTRARAVGDKIGEQRALEMLAEARIMNKIKDAGTTGHLTREAAERLCARLMETATEAA